MTIIQASLCSNCRREAPRECDGKTYKVQEWPSYRLVCRGSDAENFIRVDGTLKFREVVGHGISYERDLKEMT